MLFRSTPSEVLTNIHMYTTVDSESLKSIMNAYAFRGLTIGAEYTTEKLSVICAVINSSSTLRHVELQGNVYCPIPQSAWREFHIIACNTSLQCVGLTNGMIDGGLALQCVCANLQHLHGLSSLKLCHNDLSCPGNVSALSALLQLKSLQYLSLYHCNLGAVDMDVVAQLVTNMPLLHLNIDDNPIGDDGAATITKALGDSQCELQALHMYKCGLSQEKQIGWEEYQRSVNPYMLRY